MDNTMTDSWNLAAVEVYLELLEQILLNLHKLYYTRDGSSYQEILRTLPVLVTLPEQSISIFSSALTFAVFSGE